MRWVMAEGAINRLSTFGAREARLHEAVLDAGHELITFEWLGENTVLSHIPDDDTPTAVYAGHESLDFLRAFRPDLMPGIFHDKELNSAEMVNAELGEVALNASGVMRPTRDIKFTELPLFIRPSLSDKSFNGGVVKDEQNLKSLPDEIVLTSDVQDILSEYRFIVINGEVVTGSQYARDKQMDVRIDYLDECFDMAAHAASIYAPMGAFACDVAETESGPKVIEYNGFSTSGLYACDGRKIVRAMEEMMSRLASPEP